MPEGGPPVVAPAWRRWLKAFGAFWWDFLVGDTPEILIGVLVAIGAVALIAKGASLNTLAVIAFPLSVVGVLGGSLVRARRARH
jgi:hypothetical protein